MPLWCAINRRQHRTSSAHFAEVSEEIIALILCSLENVTLNLSVEYYVYDNSLWITQTTCEKLMTYNKQICEDYLRKL